MTITCADCGLTQRVPELVAGEAARCHRCARVLARKPYGGNDVPLACAIAAFLLLPPAVFLPMLDASIIHLLFQESRLVSSVPTIYKEVWFPFAFGFLFLALLFPAFRALFQILVLGSLRFGWRLWQRGRLFRWSEELRAWCMTDIVVIAGVIAYFRAGVAADISIRIGAWCYLAVAALALVGQITLDTRSVWNAILPDSDASVHRHVASCDVCEMAVPARRPGDPCPRCGAMLDREIAPLFIPALGAVAAAIPLTLPAYAAAVMVNDNLTGVIEHTIVGTVQLLADRGYWQFGVIVLIAGVALPLVVLTGMIWLLVRVRVPNRRGLVLRTRAYRLLNRLARWPIIIPFIAAIAAPIVDFRGIDDIVAGPGATPLFLLIALLMLAVRFFEPKLMWKSAGAVQ